MLFLQIRRGLHRLQDALTLVEKNTLGLQTNCASVTEEVDEIYRRLSKALKDRTEHLRNEVDRYLSTELRGLIQLKENLELEIANIQSNCDLAEAHINENVPWDDSELLDTKELFLRTVEFIRFVIESHPFSFLPTGLESVASRNISQFSYFLDNLIGYNISSIFYVLKKRNVRIFSREKYLKICRFVDRDNHFLYDNI